MRIVKTATLPVLGAVLLSCGVLLSACSGDNVAEHMSQASSYLHSGNYRSATIELKNVLQSQPENARAWFVLGQVSLTTGQYAEAAHQFDRARQYGTTEPSVDQLLARALIGDGQYKKALEALKPDAASDAGDRAHLYALQGRAYLGLQDSKKAGESFAAALSSKASYAPALVGQAVLAWRANKHDQARDLVQEATKADPSYARAWAVSGNLAFQQKRCDDVVTAYDRISHLQSRLLSPAQAFLARAHAAHCQLTNGQIDKATANVDGLLKVAPKSPYANYLKALLDFRNKDYKQATTHVQKTLAAAPNSTPGAILLGMIKAAQGNLKAAQLHFTDAVSQSPDNLKARQLLASVYIKRGLAKQAVRVLQGALSDHGKDADLLAMLGEASLRAGQQTNGLNYLKRSALEAPGNAKLQLAVAHRIGQIGDVGGALQLLNRVPAEDNGDTVRANILRIKLYLDNKQPNKAISEAEALVQKHAGDLRFVRLLARVYAAANQPDQARKTLENAIDSVPDNVNLRLDLGRLAMGEGKYKAARASFQTVLDKDPKNVRATVGMAKAAAKQGDESEATSWLEKAVKLRPDGINLRVALARVYLSQKRPADALPITKALVQDAPDNVQLRKLRATALWAADKRDAALKSLREAVRTVPDAIDLQLGLARMLTMRDEFDKAQEQLEETRKQFPDSVKAATMLAQLQLQQGHPDTALATAKSLGQNGKAAAAYVLTGNLMRAQKKYKNAADAYAEAYDIQPTPRLVLQLFNMRRLAGVQQPEKPLLTWLKLHPQDAAVAMALGQWYQTTGALDAAAEQYQRVLANNAGNPVALNNLAMVYFKQGDDRAIDTAEQAYAKAPKSPAVTDTLGWILVNSGKTKRGLTLVRDAAKAAPKQADIQYHLAAALVKSGDSAKARKILNKLLADNKSFASRKNAEKLFEEIQN